MKTRTFDITYIMNQTHINNINMGGVKNIPIIVSTQYGEDGYRLTDNGKTEYPIGIVISEGVLYNNMERRFYVECQLFKGFELADGIHDCEFKLEDDILKITAFVVYPD